MARTDKGYKGVGMEGSVARWYAASAGKDAGRYEEQAKQVADRAPAGSKVLEVAPGPGHLSIMLARSGDYRVTGLDVSSTFVQIARKNAAEAGVQVDFLHGSASAMPFDSDSFDFVACCAAFKNFSAPVRALREMCRVLRPAGQALVVDLRPDVSKQAVHDDVARMELGGLSRALVTFTLGSWLPRRACSKKQFEDFITQTNFRSFDIRETPMSLEVEMRK
ncbi:MAG TPA: class I SAM-dependent methyltransferase [Streptosporangiaceae bacterium]|nr:class I SAM-dependent methyltransferase [Streptosporangiaceae bacterium]